MSTVKSYPHYEINVKDNSIYNVAVEETLPVHRAVWVLPTQKGPVGQPTWVRNKTEFDRIFGRQTLDLTNKTYQSPVSYWLYNLLGLNGQFITRALPATASRAGIVLYAKVEKRAVVKRLTATKADGSTYYKTVQADITERVSSSSSTDVYTTADYGKYAIEAKEAKEAKVEEEAKVEGRTVIEVTPETVEGLIITFYTKKVDDSVLTKIENGETVTDTDVTDTGADSYPLMVVVANYKGQYGNDYAFRFWSSSSNNTPTTISAFKSVFNRFGAYYRDYNSTTTTAIVDSYDSSSCSFTANPKCVNPNTLKSTSMETTLEDRYDTNNESSEEFPFIIYSFEDSLNKIGKEIVTIVDDVDGLGLGDIGYASVDEFKTDLGDDYGYAIDVLGGCTPSGEPYPNVYYSKNGLMKTDPFYIVADSDISGDITNGTYLVCAEEDTTTDTTTGTTTIKLDSNTDIFLQDGSDGTESITSTSFIDKAMYDFVTLQTNNTIIDKFRYPFTHIYDVGYSMTTKMAMIDFTGIRDDVMAEMTTQVLCSSEWANSGSSYIKVNDQYDDISAATVLREYALLQKESVINGTDCMRVAIYPQAGRPVSIATVNSLGMSDSYSPMDTVPFVYWSAYQHATYGNRPCMSIQEPRGLPYSYNNLFRDWNWVPYYESQKELAWNTGINYCQYADMSRIFYPALRTVYRNDASILTDQWDVDALVYTKHECRKAWAHFVGRNDSAANLQAAIKTYLEEKLAYLYSGKFDFEVTVYQTEEEQKIGYIQHVKLKLTFPATLRVLIFDIEVNREGLNA